MRSYDRAPLSGTYRTRCCRREFDLRKESVLPACPGCRKVTEWALIVSNESHGRAGFGREFVFREVEGA